VGDVLKYDEAGNLLSVNLDVNNPNTGDDFEHMPPEKLVANIMKKEQRILSIMSEIQNLLSREA